MFLPGLYLSFFVALAPPALPLDQIKLPPGFHIALYARHVTGARQLAWGAHNTLFIGSEQSGNVYAVDADRRVHTIATGLNMPNGVAFKDGALYVAEVARLLRFDAIEAHLEQPPRPTVLPQSYPSERHHGMKFIAFGPDGWLYVPQGAPCNICDPNLPFASITRVHADGQDREIFARGVRNTVGFDWHPVTHTLWFTDNGRDLLGDGQPPDELNHAPRAGMHFGYPFCHGGDLVDPEFGQGKSCDGTTPPVQKLGAHVASLGMRFYTGSMFPAAYKNQVFIAEHGSWNSSVPVGYRITLVTLDAAGHATRYAPFATGWLQGGKAWGRPVDVLVAPDGALLVSDDTADAVYRISYVAP